jgi:hypothetical protein
LPRSPSSASRTSISACRQLAEQIKRIERAIQERHPEVIALYVRPRD